jgi:hypothetical protein
LCPVDQAGVLQVQHIQFYRNHIMVPAGKDWRMVRVVVDSRDAWEAREEARKAIDDLPDTVACALLGGQRDEWAMED